MAPPTLTPAMRAKAMRARKEYAKLRRELGHENIKTKGMSTTQLVRTAKRHGLALGPNARKKIAPKKKR